MNQQDSETPLEHEIAVALKSEPEVWTSDCLAPEHIIALAERSVPESEATSLMAHVALCARCRREYAETVELLQLAEETGALQAQTGLTSPEDALPADMSPSKRASPAAPAHKEASLPFWKRRFSPGLGFALGAAAASIALFFALTLPTRVQRDQLQSSLLERNTQFARMEQEKKILEKELAALKQNQGDASHVAKEVARLNGRVKTQGIQIAQLTESKAILQEIPLPTAHWMLSQERGQSRGNGGSENSLLQIALVRPINTALLDPSPTLECRPVSGATAYQVSLEREDSNEEVPAPKPLSSTRWQVEKPLLSGKIYRWVVTAQRGKEQIRSPFVKFYILSEAERHQMQTAQQKYARSPLALGAIYARLGLWDEAVPQLQTAVKASQDHEVAARWLKEIEALRSP